MKIVDIVHKLPWVKSNGTMDKKKIELLVIHHEGVKTPWMYDTVKRIQNDARYHISKGWNHISYHYMMDNVGDIFKCLPDTEVGYHAGTPIVNNKSIALCIQGNYETQTLSKAQKRALEEFCDYMFNRRPDLPKLVRTGLKNHKDVRPTGTACPGRNVVPFVNSLKK